MEMLEREICGVLEANNIGAGEIRKFWGNEDTAAFLVDGKYVFKTSKTNFSEAAKLARAKLIRLVPKIHLSGSFFVLDCEYYYLMVDYVQGEELWSAAHNLSDDCKYGIGKEIALFLDELHQIRAEAYDIGHYIPTVPGWKKTWKEGHLEYAAILQNGLSEKDLGAECRAAVLKAFEYIYANIGCLEYQAGARLLHNDFHPKNIIVNEGRVAGVIDWECSQFGEADFELSRLFDWCVYPEDYLSGGRNLEVLLRGVLENLHSVSGVPCLAERLTIYQLEHELNQLIWQGGKRESEGTQRIYGWLGRLDCGFWE